MTSTDLDQLLDDPQQAGVFFVLDEDIALLDLACEGAGLCTLRIDLRDCEGKDDLLQRLAAGMVVPAGQGRNWDALSDQLRDLSWLPANGYALLLAHAADLREADQANFDILLDILDEASVDWQARNLPLWAFLALPDDPQDESSDPAVSIDA